MKWSVKKHSLEMSFMFFPYVVSRVAKPSDNAGMALHKWMENEMEH